MSECKNKNSEGIKMAFNKKKWREHKYSCKAKVRRWDNVQRKQTQKEFNKECKKSNIKFNSRENDVKHIKNRPFRNFWEAHMQCKEIQKIKKEKRKEQERIRKEKEEAIRIYKEKKAARIKKLSQKTRKGQPVMRGRIELMLEKIQLYYLKNSP